MEQFQKVGNTPVPARANAQRKAPTKDDHGIITNPGEGVTKYYTRTGTGFYVSNNRVYDEAQSGIVTILEAEDGKVYIKNPVSHYSQNSWVEGTKDGNTITVAGGQPLAWNANYSTTLGLYWGNVQSTETGNTYIKGEGDITFTVDDEAGTITLDGSSQNKIIGVYWDDDNSWSGYGDFNSVWTLNTEYEPASTDPIVLPDGAEVLNWYADGTGSSAVPTAVKVAFVGNEVYISGLTSNFPDAWIKGTLDGTTVTFSKFQFVGNYNGTKPIWAVGADSETGNLQEFTMTYDSEAQTLTLDAGQLIVFNAAEDRMYYLSYIQSLTIYAEKPVPTVVVAPYVADFTTEAPFGDFFVIDNNEDGKTWTWSASNFANYTYNSSSAADDYLVLPIQLEAGKNYNVTVNAANSGYPEKFEVKVGKEGSVEGLTDVVIAETEVTSADFSDFSGSFTSSEAGTYYVAIHATSDADQFRLKVKTLTIEVGAAGTAPAAVNNLTVTPTNNKVEATIVFEAPSTTVNGDEMTENLTKIDVLRDGVVIESFADVAPGSERTVVDNEEKGLTIGAHKYQVIPYNANGIGQKSEEVSVLITATLSVPYTFDLTQDQTELFTIIDNNEDGKTWSFNSSIGTIYSYSSTNPGDDYLVSPAFNLEAGKSYKVTVNAKSYNAGYTERFMVKVGKVATAEGLNITVIDTTAVSSTDAEDFEEEFTVSEAGEYFIAIQAVSEPDNWRLVVNSLSIEKGLEPTAPAAPELAVTPAAEGAKSAKIEVTAPSQTIGGNELTAENLTKIEILRDNELLTTLNVLPGNVAEYTDENVPDTLHTYQAIPYDANNEAGKKSEKVTVYVGLDSPADVQNFHVKSTTATSITFAWDAATGAHDGYVDPTTMKYEVSTLKVEQSILGAYLVVDQTVADVTGQTELTIDFPVDEGQLMYQYFGISAINSKAASDPTLAYSELLVGEPEAIPLYENFEGKSLHFAWNTNGGLGVSTNSSDEDGTALKLYNNENGEEVYFMLDKVNLKTAANPTLLVDVRSESTDKVYGIGSMDGGEPQVLAEADVTADYTTFKVPLTSIMNAERYSTVGIKANIETPSIQNYEDTLIIDNIRIVDLYEYDLAVTLTAPKSFQTGDYVNFYANIENKGENAASNYTLKVKVNDKVIFNKTYAEELPAFAKQQIRVPYETTIFDEAADLVITAEVEYANDLDTDNNEAQAAATLKEPNVAPVENLTAEVADGGVALAWSVKDNTATEVVEDFAAYDNGANETGMVGGWTLVNNNGATKGGMFKDLQMSNDGIAGAWEVIKPSEYGITNTQFAGPNGTVEESFVISAYNTDGSSYPDNDDYLISPILSGAAQTISFYANALSVEYGPSSFEVLYSTTDKEVSSFIPVAGASYDLTEAGWNQYQVALPEGAKYFAIHNNTPGDGAFCLAVGNISFLPGSETPVSFNIYVDFEAVDNAEGTEYLYETEDTDEFHTFSVTAVYSNGESKPVTINWSNGSGIEKIFAAGKDVNVYTIDGKYLGKATSLKGLKGAFIVNNKKVVLK